MKIQWLMPILLPFMLLRPGVAVADDTQIYGSTNVAIQPNVLIIFDNSGSMRNSIAETPPPYDPLTDYSSYGSHSTNAVYRSQGNSWNLYIANVSSVTCISNPGGVDVKNTLQTAGQYSGKLASNGTCGNQSRTTALGNYLNYLDGPGLPVSTPKVTIARDVIRTLIQNTEGVRFGLMSFNDDNEGGHILKEVSDMSSGTNQADLLAALDALQTQVLNGDGTNTPLAETMYEAGLYYQGASGFFNPSYDSSTDYSAYGSYAKNTVYRRAVGNHGAWTSFITNVSSVTCGQAHSDLTSTGQFLDDRLASDGTCPGSGTRYDFKLGNDLNYRTSPKTVYTTPIEYSCQKNYIVLMTDGDPTHDDDDILTTAVGNTDGEPTDPSYLDDAAEKWYDTDLIPTGAASAGVQKVVTYTIGFSTGSAAANTLLNRTATNGRGQFYAADSAQELANAFLSALGQIVEDNTSFVAPVVPVSPQNKTYSGDYVYIGFFRPAAQAFWSGNMKKYAIVKGEIMGSDSPSSPCVPTAADPIPPAGHCVPATYTTGVNAGSFKEIGVYSFWSTTEDGGAVEKGGVGAILHGMTLQPTGFLSPLDSGYNVNNNVRQIYTYFSGNDSQLAHTTNQFETTNALITTTVLSVSTTTEKDNLIKYIHGQDVYSGLTAARDWVLGDVLHSGPTIVSYDDGQVSGTPMSVIYVGSNDGMLHAFVDTTGRELWSYIPNNQLSHLKALDGVAHPYSVDGSPKAYILDNDHDGVIEQGDGDKVYLIFGERRGYGLDADPHPSYHALDVTDPVNPIWLWDIKRGDNLVADGPDLTELGQTWSAPNIQKIKISGSDCTPNPSPCVIDVFFVGGGYDPVNEDAMPAATDTQGRAVYAIRVDNGKRIWSYDHAGHSSGANAINYSVPSDVTAIDTNRDGYADLLYVGDVGGQIWRFDISNLDTSAWTGRILFKSNSGGSKRKILYPPDVTREIGYYYLYFGTGDREHPLDLTGGTNVATPACSDAAIDKCDRIYGVKDFDNSTASLTESNLWNVTTNVLQDVNSTSVEIDQELTHLYATGCGGNPGDDTNGCGWYIALSLNLGERTVGSATLFNKVVNIPTFQPTSTNVTVEPCLADVGVGRVYAVNYKTGEAVFNYSTLNDSAYDSAPDTTQNNRARNTDDSTLLTRDTSLTGSTGDDRVKTVGAGIPSEVVIVIPQSGSGACDAMAMAGIGGGVSGLETGCGGTTQWIYWRELLN